MNSSAASVLIDLVKNQNYFSTNTAMSHDLYLLSTKKLHPEKSEYKDEQEEKEQQTDDGTHTA